MLGRMKNATESLWLRRIEAWKASGKPAEEFAAGQPFKGSTLVWRASQLRNRVKRGENGKGTASNETRKSPGFAKVRVMQGSGGQRHLGDLTIDVAGARISVGQGFDRTLLREVVLALKEGA
jgi:hypothetical protein